MKLFSFSVLLGGVLSLGVSRSVAQAPPTPLTLSGTIELALSQSAVARQAQAARQTSHWQYRAFRAGYKPQLALGGVLPDYSRAIQAIIQPDGNTSYKYVRMNTSSLGTTITQNLGLTGGQLTVGSALQRLDNLEARQRQYNTSPVTVGLVQPLGAFNGLRWNKRIEPLRYQEAGRQLAQDQQTIARRVAELYFDVLLQQVNAQIARQNRQASADLLRLGRERHRLGRLSENDLLQLELNLLSAEQAEIQAGVDARLAAVNLTSYTGLPFDASAGLAVPAAAPALRVSPDEALALARQYRRETLQFQRRLLEADRLVAQARGTTGLQASLTAGFGLANSADELPQSYLSPSTQQQVRLSFSVPLMDWGRTRATIRTAELSRQQEQYAVAQEQTAFEQTVRTQAAQLDDLAQQLALAARADTLAQRRYAIARATYQLGRFTLTDLTLAQAAKDQARRSYIAALRACWVAYYQLRTLTLFDFERQQPLLSES